MTREERQLVIDLMASSCTQEDKDYVKAEVVKWCNNCNEANKHIYTAQTLHSIKSRAIMHSLADNAKCNILIKNGNFTKEAFLHNQILKLIVIKLGKAEAKVNSGEVVTDVVW